MKNLFYLMILFAQDVWAGDPLQEQLLPFTKSHLFASSEEIEEGTFFEPRQMNLNTQDLSLMPYTNTIIGADIFLRPLFPNDYQGLIPIFTDTKYTQYFGTGVSLTIPEIKERAARQAKYNGSPIFFQGYQGVRFYHWAIITAEGIAGQISIIYPHQAEKMTELFYCVVPHFSGRGIATKASQIVLEFIPGSFIATAHPLNSASAAILKKLGFKPDRVRQNVKKYGSSRHYYILSRDQ